MFEFLVTQSKYGISMFLTSIIALICLSLNYDLKLSGWKYTLSTLIAITSLLIGGGFVVKSLINLFKFIIG